MTTAQPNLPWQFRAIRAGLHLLDRLAPPLSAAAALHLFLSPRRRLRPYDPALLAAAEPLELPFEGQRLRGYSWGAGPVVLLAHGWETDASHLGGFVAPLVAAGRRVIAFDAPAHGASGGRTTDILHYSRALAAISAAYGPLDGLLAHSLGGSAALWLAAHNPAPLFPRMVIIASPTTVMDSIDQFVQILNLPQRTFQQLEAAFRRRFGRSPREVSIDRQALELSVPGLIIHDRNDRQVGFHHGEAYAAAWPQAQFIATEGLGHNRILRDPAVISAACEFLVVS